METNVIVKDNYTQEKIDLIKNVIAKDATDLELKFFIEQCKRTGLDPITRQIYFIKDKNGKVNVQTSIDGFRLIADRSGEYGGQTAPMWCGEDGVWKDVWLSNRYPKACKIGVYKTKFREPLYAIALFDEYAQKDHKTNELQFMWKNKPALMLAKVCEALALRKAFPNEMSGLYTQDEYTPEVKPAEQQLEKITDAWRKEMAPSPEFRKQVVQEIHETQKNEYVINFGKHNGKTIDEIGVEEARKYASWLITESEKANRPINAYGKEFIDQVNLRLRG